MTNETHVSSHPVSDGREVRVTHNGHESLIYMAQADGTISAMICSMYGAPANGTREAARIVRGIEFDLTR